MPETGKNMLLVTGATGFIGSRLVRDLLKQRTNASIIALVLKSDLFRARRLKEELLQEGIGHGFHWVIGDIAKSNLGLGEKDLTLLLQDTREIYHLAAFYRLDVRAETAWKVNVLGTEEMVRFAKRCLRLEKFHHFSSLVAGARKPQAGRPFLNHYERTKYLSEVLIRENLKGCVKTINIFRPGVVVGDSQKGVTDKFDGLYFCLTFLWRFRGFLNKFPLIAQGKDLHFPVVPVDFVAQAASYISQYAPEGLHIYPLAEEEKISWQCLYDHLFEKIIGKRPNIRIHPRWIKRLCFLPKVEEFLELPGNSLSYVDYQIPFDVIETKKILTGSGIPFPSFWNYTDVILKFFLAHAQDRNRFAPPNEPISPSRHPRLQFPFAESKALPREAFEVAQ